MMFRAMIVTLSLLAPSAAAQEMPHYDVEAHCAKMAELGGSSETMRSLCYQSEQRSYDELKPRWAGLPAEMRAHCDKLARLGGAGNYAMLSICVTSELRAAEENRSFSFQR